MSEKKRVYGKVDNETFRSRASTVDQDGKRKWVYATKPSGKLYTIRKNLSYFYFAIFLIMPLIHINGVQFLQLNVVEGKFSIFGKIFWPNDFFIFAVIFIIGVLLIALFTVIYGRIFCGWICPQTIFMEFLFRRIEWWIEGTPAQQRRLDKAPWNQEKILKKGGKHVIFFAVSFLIANTFLAYIIGSKELFIKIRQPITENLGILTGLLIFTSMFYFVFAYVRDIVCTTICPYGRLQGVLYDKDTVQISYDYKRGEPRGKLKDKKAMDLGDCIDCFQCVTVCPTGIDIRNGPQMECVGCTACIDACDDIMTKINLPTGLIRYASENEIQSGRKMPFTTRAKAYTAVLVLLVTILAALIITRKNVDIYLSRVKGHTYQVSESGSVSNLFDAKIINKSRKDIPVQIKVLDGVGEVKVIGHKDGIVLQKEALNKITFFIEYPKGKTSPGSSKIKVGIFEGDKPIQIVKANFLGPFKY